MTVDPGARPAIHNEVPDCSWLISSEHLRSQFRVPNLILALTPEGIQPSTAETIESDRTHNAGEFGKFNDNILQV